jgi:hypothetical protein
LFASLISHQSAVLFSQNKSATSNQPAVLFSQNKPAPAISHQPNEQAVRQTFFKEQTESKQKKDKSRKEKEEDTLTEATLVEDPSRQHRRPS